MHIEDINILSHNDGPNYNTDMEELQAQGYVRV